MTNLRLKKAAMFGLFRAYEKQSGGLFLARRQSVAPKEVHGSFKATRAAMFGLDARIALAIFGALSVIGGAALYSAIQDAKVTQHWQSLKELTKATEQYYLDTGLKLEEYPAPNHSLYLGDLFVNRDSLSTWKGPYLSGGKFRYNTANSLYYNVGDVDLSVHVQLRPATLSGDQYCAVGAPECYNWYQIMCNSASLVELCDREFGLLDDHVDNGDGDNAGTIRVLRASSSAHFYWIRGLPQERQS